MEELEVRFEELYTSYKRGYRAWSGAHLALGLGAALLAAAASMQLGGDRYASHLAGASSLAAAVVAFLNPTKRASQHRMLFETLAAAKDEAVCAANADDRRPIYANALVAVRKLEGGADSE